MNKYPLIILPMTLEKHSSLQDGSIKLTFVTQEARLDKDIIAEIITLQGRYLQVSFREGEQVITESELPNLPPASKKENKSKSKQLRNILYVFWEKSNQTGTFNEYYDSYYDKRISTIKKELDKYE